MLNLNNVETVWQPVTVEKKTSQQLKNHDIANQSQS
jgi:hypothetical protein